MTTDGQCHRPVERLRYGFVPLTQPGRPPGRAEIEALEAMGAASLWAPGHVASGRPVPEAVVGAARLAALSERATVGTAVLLAPLYHPVIVAKQFAELDVATAGRMMLGVGVGGEYPSEFRACQTPIEDRGARADEAITIIRRLWSAAGAGDGEIDHAGPRWPFEGVGIMPPPVQPGGPPIIVAGRKPPAMRRAGALGDGWMPFLCSPDQYAQSVRLVRDHAVTVGRDLSSFRWMCFVYVSVARDAAEARRKALDFIGAGQAGDGSRFDAVVDRVAALGTSSQVAARLREFVDAGVRHFVVMLCERDDQVAAARVVMDDVVPEVGDAVS